MGMFIFLVGFILFMVSTIMLIINFFKKKPKKKLAIAAVVGFVLLIIGPSISPDSKKETTSKTSETSKVSESSTSSSVKESSEEKTKESSSEETKQSDKKDSDAEANKLIANDLQQDLGWALGKLDSDGNPTENGTPNEDFAWAVFVEKVEIAEDGTQLNVYVTPEFTSLNDESKSKIISSAQNMASIYTDNAEKLFTVVYQGDKQIGRSTVLDKSEFKFDK